MNLVKAQPEVIAKTTDDVGKKNNIFFCINNKRYCDGSCGRCRRQRTALERRLEQTQIVYLAVVSSLYVVGAVALAVVVVALRLMQATPNRDLFAALFWAFVVGRCRVVAALLLAVTSFFFFFVMFCCEQHRAPNAAAGAPGSICRLLYCLFKLFSSSIIYCLICLGSAATGYAAGTARSGFEGEFCKACVSASIRCLRAKPQSSSVPSGRNLRVVFCFCFFLVIKSMLAISKKIAVLRSCYCCCFDVIVINAMSVIRSETTTAVQRARGYERALKYWYALIGCCSMVLLFNLAELCLQTSI